jgi:hypothetical protein
MIEHFCDNGHLIFRWDDSTRTFTEWDHEGVLVQERPYNADENAAADVRSEEHSRIANEQTLRDGLEQAIIQAEAMQADLQGLIDTANATINSNPAPYIKGLADAQKKTLSGLIRLIRLVGKLTDSSSTGSISK